MIEWIYSDTPPQRILLETCRLEDGDTDASLTSAEPKDGRISLDTDASRSSRTPMFQAAAATVFCLVAGLTILITQNSLPAYKYLRPKLYDA